MQFEVCKHFFYLYIGIVIFRCPNCVGWPISVGCKYETPRCGYCEEEVDDETVNKYFKVKTEFLMSDIKTVDAAIKHLNVLFTVLHSYDLCFIAICQITLLQYMQANLIKESMDMARILKTIITKLIPKSSSEMEIRGLLVLLNKML